MPQEHTASKIVNEQTAPQMPQEHTASKIVNEQTTLQNTQEQTEPQNSQSQTVHQSEAKEVQVVSSQIVSKLELKEKQNLTKKPDLLKDFSDKELLWLVRVLNVAQIVKRGGKEIGLTELASSILKIYGVNAWIKDLPQFSELLLMMQDFSERFDFIMKLTAQQDYIIFFSAQVFEIGRNSINYLLNKNKKIIEWKQSLLDFEFSIDEISVINIMADLMDKMISDSMLPIWRELKPRLQNAISNKKPAINISKGLEDFIEKLINKGVISFARINGEIILQLKKRMNIVGMFEDN